MLGCPLGPGRHLDRQCRSTPTCSRRTANAGEPEQAVRDSKELLQSIVDNSTAVIYLADLEGRYLMINRRYAEQFHVSEQAILGRTDYDIFPRERADAFRAVDQEVVATGTALQAEEEAPQDDGLHTYISLRASPAAMRRGGLYAVCGISTDITRAQAGRGGAPSPPRRPKPKAVRRPSS